MSPAAELAEAFVRRFCAGDVDALARLLAPDVAVRGPLLHCDGRDAYLAALRADPPQPGAAQVHSVLAQDDRAAVFWDRLNANAPLPFAHHFRVCNGRIAAIRVVYDPSALPVASLPAPDFRHDRPSSGTHVSDSPPDRAGR